MLDNKSFAHALPAEPEAIATPGNATSERAVVIETTDVAADDSTTATMAVGDTYVGDLEVVGDRRGMVLGSGIALLPLKPQSP